MIEKAQKTIDVAMINSDLLSYKIARGIEAATNVGTHSAPFVIAFSIFVLACFVGYFVVWRVTPALHTPLMAVTNAISSVIVVGAIIALGAADSITPISVLSFVAIVIASVNIFGGFFVTYRMLAMFKR